MKYGKARELIAEARRLYNTRDYTPNRTPGIELDDRMVFPKPRLPIPYNPDPDLGDVRTPPGRGPNANDVEVWHPKPRGWDGNLDRDPRISPGVPRVKPNRSPLLGQQGGGPIQRPNPKPRVPPPGVIDQKMPGHPIGDYWDTPHMISGMKRR